MKYFPLLFLILISLGAATTTISSLPYTISNPDTYILSTNFTGNYSIAITIASDNVTLDCQGNSITGNYTSNTYGIYYLAQNNVTIQNCNVTRFFTELYARSGNQSIIINNSFTYSNRTDVILGDLAMMNGTYFANNTVQYGDENGVECYNQNNSIFENNTMGFHLFGHGTDRDFQFVQNIYNTIFRYNFLQNSTNSIRLDNNNYTNVLIDSNTMINHQVQGIINQVQVGTFTNVTISNNNVTSIPYPANPTASLDWATAGRLTPLNQCQEWHVFNNTGSTGRPIIYLNQYNSSQSYSNLEVSQLSLCGVQNATFSNITMISVMNNYLESIDTVNVTFDNIHQYNVSSGFFIGGTAINTTITNSDAHNIKLIAINSADPANANIYAENLTFENLVQYGIRPSGANNTFRNVTVRNQFSTIASTGTFGVTTTGTTPTNLILDNIRVYNQTYGMDIFAGTNTTITNSYIENSTTYDFLFNSTASGSKTYSANNLTIGNMGGTKTTTFGVVDTVAASEQYGIKLATSFSSPPAGKYAITGAVLNMTAIAGTMNFTSFNMSWSQKDVQLYNESAIILDQYNNVNWITLNNTPDTTNKIITYNSPALTAGTSNLYGLLSTAINCPVINISGSYSAPTNYNGAPNSDDYATNACVIIKTPNTNFDCAGNTINANGSSGTGVSITSGLSSISLTNCNVVGYSNGIYSISPISQTYSSNNFTNSTTDGISIQGGYYNVIDSNKFTTNTEGIGFGFGDLYNNITNNVFNSNSVRGINLNGGSNYNLFDHNNFSGENIAISLLSSSPNRISFNKITGAGFQALQIVGDSGSSIINNTITGSGQYSVYGSSSSHMNISGNNLSTSAFTAVYLDPTSTLNSVDSNYLISNAQDGVTVEGGSNTISNNIMISNANAGVTISSSGNQVTSNTAHENGIGINLYGGSASLSNNHLYNNTNDLEVSGAGSNNSITTTNDIFDNPAGNYQNYSNISLSDNVLSSESYSISYGANVDPSSTGNLSVNNATVQFTNLSNANLDQITWYYRVGSYNSTNEPSIRVWQFTTPPPTWAALSSILNIPSKTVQLANVGTTGRYTLLYDPDFIGSVINSIVINYYHSQPYSTYTHTSTTITTADTGFFLVNYVTNGVAPDILAPLLTISSFIPIIAIGLLSLIAIKAILDAYKQN